MKPDRRGLIALILVWGAFTAVGCTGISACSPPPRPATPSPSMPIASLTLSPISTLPVTPKASKPPITLPAAPPTKLAASERLCSQEDLTPPALPPDVSDPATLIGFRPPRHWIPGPDWQPSYGFVILGTEYSISGYTLQDQHLVLLEKRICRYGEHGRYALFEIVDAILLSDLQANELVVAGPGILLPFSDAVSKRLEYQIEIFAEAKCSGLPPHAITRCQYDLAGLPDSIAPGYQLPIQVLRGWLPDTELGGFETIPVDHASCTIHFYGK